MIRFLVDIERDVIRLVIRHVFTIGQVERDIEKVHDFFVGFDRYFKAMLAEDVAQILFNLFCLSILAWELKEMAWLSKLAQSFLDLLLSCLSQTKHPRTIMSTAC